MNSRVLHLILLLPSLPSLRSFRSAFSWITSAAVIQMFEFLCCTRGVLSCKWWKSHKWMGLKIIMEKLTLLIITYLYPHKASTTIRCFSLSLPLTRRSLSQPLRIVKQAAPLIQIRQRASCSVPWFKMNKWIIYLEQRAFFCSNIVCLFSVLHLYLMKIWNSCDFFLLLPCVINSCVFVYLDGSYSHPNAIN